MLNELIDLSMNTSTGFQTLLLATVLSLLLTACAPTLTYQLRPVSGDITSMNGRLVTKAASPDSVVVVASYEREELQYIALDIEVKNQTGHAIDVDPARFSTVALDRNQQLLPDPVSAQPFYQQVAADPDREAKRVVTDRVQEEKRLKRAKIMNTVLMVAVVVGSVAATSKPQSYEKYVSNQIIYNGASQAIQAKRIIDHTTFASRMQRFDYEAYRWHELALKRTAVQSGESVRGFVYLPKNPKAAFLQLQYPAADGTNVVILFEQTTGRKR